MIAKTQTQIFEEPNNSLCDPIEGFLPVHPGMPFLFREGPTGDLRGEVVRTDVVIGDGIATLRVFLDIGRVDPNL